MSIIINICDQGSKISIMEVKIPALVEIGNITYDKEIIEVQNPKTVRQKYNVPIPF